MKVHEYQAKKILAEFGVPVPKGGVASTPQEAAGIAGDLGGNAVVKAQVSAGGRGKAGGVRLVSSPDAARDYAASLIGSRLVTHQTGPQGVPVHKLLVEAPADIDRERYLAITVDRRSQGPLFIASVAGERLWYSRGPLE